MQLLFTTDLAFNKCFAIENQNKECFSEAIERFQGLSWIKVLTKIIWKKHFLNYLLISIIIKAMLRIINLFN